MMLRIFLISLLFAAPLSQPQAETMFGESKEKRFWNWFQKNEDRLFNFEVDQDVIFDGLQAELAKIYSSAAFEFGPVLADGRREFFLSAGGNADDFPAVEALYSAAPALPRWVLVKFIPRRGDDPLMTTEVGGKLLHASQLRFSLVPAGTRVDVSVFVQDATTYDAEALRYLVWIVLQTNLGEEDLALRVRHYRILDEKDRRYAVSKEIAGLESDFDAYFAEQRKSYH